MSRQLGIVLLASLAVAAAAPVPARAAATMTSPANGAKISFDKQGLPSFAWTLPSGEVDPQVSVAPQAAVPDPATFIPEDFGPFEFQCGAPRPSGDLVPAYSCQGDEPLAAGAYYAYIDTAVPDGDGFYDHLSSPLTSFVMPPFLVWGDPVDPVRAIKTGRDRMLGGAGPFVDSYVEVRGWFNDPEGKVRFKVTVKHGHRLVKRFRRTEEVSGEGRGGGWVAPVFDVKRKRGVRAGSRLTCRIVMTAGGITRVRTVRMKAV